MRRAKVIASVIGLIGAAALSPTVTACRACASPVSSTLLGQTRALSDDPRLVRARLANGVTAIVCPRPSRGLAAVDVWVRAGSALEGPGELGAAHFVEHLLFRGTAKRGPGEVDRAIESLGGLLNAGTTRDFSHMFAVLPADKVADALVIIADALTGSLMALEHMEIERSVILDELARAQNDPNRDVIESAFRAAWGAAPYGRPVLSVASDIAALGRDSVLAFYRRCYQPDRMVVVVAGEVGPNAAMAAIKSAFEPIPRGGGPREAADDVPPLEPGPAFGPVRTLPRSGAPAEEVWAWRVGRRDNREALMAELLAAITEDALAAARSPQSAGDPQPGARAEAIPLVHGALFYIASSVGATGKSVSPALLEGVIKRLSSDGPTDNELEFARRRVLGRSLFRQETCAGMARELGMWAMLGDAEVPLELGARLKQISRNDLRVFAARWLDNGKGRAGSGEL